MGILCINSISEDLIFMARTKVQLTSRKASRKSAVATGRVKDTKKTGKKNVCPYCEKGPLLVGHHLRKYCIIKNKFNMTANDIRTALDGQVIQLVDTLRNEMEKLSLEKQTLLLNINYKK